MAICMDCKKDWLTNYQTIKTKRNTTVYICNECFKKYQRKEGSSANNS